MQIQKVGFRYYKSIGDQAVELDFAKRSNLLIGPNNAGKSNAISALVKLFEKRANWRQTVELELHKRGAENPPMLNIEGIFQGTTEKQKAFSGDIWRFEEQKKPSLMWRNPFDTWDHYKKSNLKLAIQESYFQSGVSEKQWSETVSSIADQIVKGWLDEFKQVVSIPAFRRISDGGYELAGNGVVPLLASWKTPEIGKDTDRRKFENVQQFLRQLVGMPDAELEVPPGKSEIIIRNSDLRLPLLNYGSGMHQLIILAIAVLEYSEAIICLEEPEVHLHPRLQRAFLNFLIDKTSNQYVIATHSPFFLSRPSECHIIRLWTEEGVTKNEVITTTQQSLDILRDLGVSASDIMQSRFVIWVEGPSDAIYLRRWIEIAIEQGLSQPIQEGVDFSIMFYGGRLLSHLSLNHDQPEVEDALNVLPLLPINRNAAVLIDSDKGNKSSELNDTKSRIIDECEKSGSFHWVTEGREIENYLPVTAIEAAYAEKNISLSGLKFTTFASIDNAIKKVAQSSSEKPPKYADRKVYWAKAIAPHVKTIDQLDLSNKLLALMQAILKAHV